MIGPGSAVQLASEDRANKERDERNRVLFVEMGYEVLVFWECELKGDGVATAVEIIRETIARRQPF